MHLIEVKAGRARSRMRHAVRASETSRMQGCLPISAHMRLEYASKLWNTANSDRY